MEGLEIQRLIGIAHTRPDWVQGGKWRRDDSVVLQDAARAILEALLGPK
jgi:hypothetical protein